MTAKRTSATRRRVDRVHRRRRPDGAALHRGDGGVTRLPGGDVPGRSAVMPLRLAQRLIDIVRAAAADDLDDTSRVRLAEDGAIGAGLAETVGAAAVSLGVLREFAAGLFAGALNFGDGMFAQRDVPGQRRSAEAKDANKDKKDTQVSHGCLQRSVSPPLASPQCTTFRPRSQLAHPSPAAAGTRKAAAIALSGASAKRFPGRSLRRLYFNIC
jgi:hypothetical protein